MLCLNLDCCHFLQVLCPLPISHPPAQNAASNTHSFTMRPNLPSSVRFASRSFFAARSFINYPAHSSKPPLATKSTLKSAAGRTGQMGLCLFNFQLVIIFLAQAVKLLAQPLIHADGILNVALTEAISPTTQYTRAPYLLANHHDATFSKIGSQKFTGAFYCLSPRLAAAFGSGAWSAAGDYRRTCHLFL